MTRNNGGGGDRPVGQAPGGADLAEEARWQFADLSADIDGCRQRIDRACQALSRFFIGKDEVIRMMFVCAAAGEPLLLVGEPGTAKSDLVVKFAECAAVPGDEYFEYMLTKFTEPNEILGPIDINRLKEGDYIRRVAGKLPEARVVFLDEIFKSNSAILNTLLTVLNERKFYQNGVPTRVRLSVFFAATNSIPELSELDALKDRFIVKVPCTPVREDHFDSLITHGLRNEVYRTFGERPWANFCQLDDFLKVKAWLERRMAGLTGETAEPDFDFIEHDRKMFFGEGPFNLFRSLVRTLEKEDRVKISDRKVIKLYKLIRTHAFLSHGGEVRPEDIAIVRYTSDNPDDAARISEKVATLLNLRS